MKENLGSEKGTTTEPELVRNMLYKRANGKEGRRVHFVGLSEGSATFLET